jgi:crossover junction endodeoxyribonuclease RuvC
MARRSTAKARAGSWRAFQPGTPVLSAVPPALPSGAASVRVLGLDPGSLNTGYGVVDVDGPALRWVAHGAIQVKGEDFIVRLRRIHAELVTLLERYQPDEVAIERVFVNRNVDSALKLGQARGAALAAVPASVSVYEYAPRVVKLSVVGAGSAEKQQVQHMVTQLVAVEGRPSADAADALAIAICHANHRRLLALAARAVPA